MKLASESEEVLFTDEEAARVKRKIDFIILPLLCGCYIFSVGPPPPIIRRFVLTRSEQFLDKTLINYSSIFGLNQALNLHGSDYSWLGRSVIQEFFPCKRDANRRSIFYIGYMIGSMVWAKLVHQWPQHTGKLITAAVLAWSTIVLLTRKPL